MSFLKRAGLHPARPPFFSPLWSPPSAHLQAGSAVGTFATCVLYGYLTLSHIFLWDVSCMLDMTFI